MSVSTKRIIWIDSLSIYSIPEIIKLSYRYGGAHVFFIKNTYLAYLVITFVKALRLAPINISKRYVHPFGDMWIGEESMAAKIQFEGPKVAEKILLIMKETDIYKSMLKDLPERKLDIFLEQNIHDEIYPLVKLLLTAEWHKAHNAERPIKAAILFPNYALASALKKVFDGNYKNIELVSYRYVPFKNIAKNVLAFFTKYLTFRRIRFNLSTAQASPIGGARSKPSIAAHYVQGNIGSHRRSDLFWFPKSGIRPDRVILYFNKISLRKKYKGDIEKISDIGMRRAVITDEFIGETGNIRKLPEDVRANNLRMIICMLKKKVKNPLDMWIYTSAKSLIKDVLEWIKFIVSSNIKIVINIGVQGKDFVAEAIALDYTDGVRIGVQRTRLGLMEFQPFLRYNPNHIFFVWGEEVCRHSGSSKSIGEFIVAGYPFDAAFSGPPKEDIMGGLKEEARFTLALYDSGMGRDLIYSESMMSDFYRKFLEWLLSDEKLVIILKEKRQKLPNELKDVRDLFYKAEATGRFIRIPDPFGRFPSDASRSADIAVGIGLTTAVMEAVITGCRGVYCDLSKYHEHYLYKNGYEKIVFDDTDRLIAALRRYKKNRSIDDPLGDWSGYLKEIEPFRDGRGGERIGAYVRWLLEGFDMGLSRNKAIEQADKRYINMWGEDKILKGITQDQNLKSEPMELETRV